MQMKIELHKVAQRDLLLGYSFYESHEIGLGSYFIDSLFADIDSLRLYAGIHSLHWGFYRMLSLRFPYAIYYKISEDKIRVYAILSCRKNPEKSKRNLKNRRF